MSQENVEIVRCVYEAAARHDTANVLDFYDPEIEWDISHAPFRDVMGEPHVFNGHEGLRTFFRQWYEAWKHVEPDLEELLDGGDQIISVETTRGRGRTSGAVVELPHAAVWTIREGKIVTVVWFGSRAEALEAAGLQE
ncbi:MAG: nuclear transport factor 2 family protein [Actinomycetota bacterium]